MVFECTRRIIATCFLVASIANAAPVQPPPREPVTETLFGRTLTDEYRWMEDPARYEALKAWLLASDADARATLLALPTRAEFAASLKSVSGSISRVGAVALANDRVLVYQRTGATDRVPKLVIREGSRERVLLDPNASKTGTAINNHSLSPDGRYVAVHTAEGGSEEGSITVYELASGKPVGQPIRPVWGEFRLSWIDSQRVAYTLMAEPGQYADRMQGMRAYVQRLDGMGEARLLLGPETSPVAVQPRDFPRVAGSAISPWVSGIAAGARADVELMVVHRNEVGGAATPWRRIADLKQEVRSFGLRGDDLFMLSTRDHPYGQLTRVTLSRSGTGDPKTLLQGTEQFILENVEVTSDGIYVQGISDGQARLYYSAGRGSKFVEIKLPFEGSIVDLEAARDGRSLSLGLTGWLTNTHYYKVRGGSLRPLHLASESWAGAANFRLKRMLAVSRDGTKVPLVAMYPRTPSPSGGYPALMQGYGSYGESSTAPFYSRFGMAWVLRGGVMARCGTRGGGERGRGWHEAGRAINKVNAQEDLLACAQTLKAEGLARAVGPVVMGTSAGGLLAPPAALKDPSAFAALISRVGIVNPTRLAAAPNGANQFDEMGDPNTADGWAALASQDAYLMAATAADMPHTLLNVGLNDKRVAPWMTAKLAALAMQRFGNRRSILLRADTDAGHGIGSAEGALQAEFADIFAFAWSHASR